MLNFVFFISSVYSNIIGIILTDFEINWKQWLFYREFRLWLALRLAIVYNIANINQISYLHISSHYVCIWISPKNCFPFVNTHNSLLMHKNVLSISEHNVICKKNNKTDNFFFKSLSYCIFLPANCPFVFDGRRL